MANREFRRHRRREERQALQAEAQPRSDAAGVAGERARTSPGEFLREVRQELRKVAWPHREEVVSYTVVVLAVTAVLIAIVFAMDFVFGRFVFTLFGS